MKSDVPFHDLGHETIQRAAAGSHQLQNSSAFLLRIEGSLDGVYLSTNPSNSRQKLFFVFSGMRHDVHYTIVQYSKEREMAEFLATRWKNSMFPKRAFGS